MGAKERRKGNEAERAVVACLKYAGWEAVTSRAKNGTQDGYDIITNAPLAIEVKNHVRLDLSAWVAQAKSNADDKVPVVWHKKRGETSPLSWYVTMDGEALVQLLEMMKRDADGDDSGK